MSRVKVIVAAVIFFVITAIKLAFPMVAHEMKSVVVPQIQQNTDFRGAMVNLGEKITGDEGIVSALGQIYKRVPFTNLSSDAQEMQGFDDTAETGENEEEVINPPGVGSNPVSDSALGPELALAAFPEPTPEATPEQLPEPMPEPTPEVTATPDVVTVFLESQADYVGYETPYNVSYDMPQLPFEYMCPVGGFNSSGFGFRRHPIEGRIKFHYGTDIAAHYGTDIRTFGGGTVLVAGYSDSYGSYIIISHEDGYSSLYAHCSELYVESRQHRGKRAGNRTGGGYGHCDRGTPAFRAAQR